ncbi:MAG: CoA pyrophosphatase [Myxococcales bacterium]
MLPPPFDRIRELLARRPVGLTAELPAEMGPVTKTASVLVPLLLRRGDPFLVLTRRTEQLTLHAGQISFPGGGRDEGDADELATALREADEEIGLAPADVEPLGPLDRIETITAYRVSPFVGAIPDAYPYRPAAAEVAEILELPLAGFLAAEALEIRELELFGQRRETYRYTVNGQVVWGATGRIVKNLLEVVAPVLRGC